MSPAPTQRSDPSVPSTRSRRTRQRLLTAALELFQSQGYDATSVSDIAAAAGVTEMTFYRHFGTKDQLLVSDPYDPLIAAAIGEQPRDLDPLARAVRGVRLAWRRTPVSEEEAVRERIAIIAATPSLLPSMRASSAATEEAIADRLVADGADPSEAAVAAAATMAALMAGLLRWATGGDGSLSEAIENALDVLSDGESR